MADQALSGIKVIDLTQEIVGPYCAKHLADYGAEVIKVEPPNGGDPARRLGPFPGDVPHYEKSLTFLHLNTNKLGITLNLKTTTGKKIFTDMVKDADLLVESFSPKVMPGLGLSYQTLKEINPRLVMSSITDYGQWGPYADRDYKATAITRYAWTGSMIYTGAEDREPLMNYGHATDYLAGTAAVPPTLAALYLAQAKGIGQQVDFSTFEFQVRNCDRRASNLPNYSYSGSRVYWRTTERSRDILSKAAHRCKDGFMASVCNQDIWPRLCAWIGRPDLLTDPRCLTPELRSRRENKDYIEAAFLPWVIERTKAEINETALEHRIWAASVSTAEDVFLDRHMQERGFFVEVDHPTVGRLHYPGAPFKMMESPWQAGRAPMLGEHNVDIYCGRLGYSKQDLVLLRERGVI